jgi:hypothetical protein
MRRAWLCLLLSAGCGGTSTQAPPPPLAPAPTGTPVLVKVSIDEDVDGVVPHDVVFAVRTATERAFAGMAGYRLVTGGEAEYVLTVEIARYIMVGARHECALAMTLVRVPEHKSVHTLNRSRAHVGGDEGPLDCARDLTRDALEEIRQDLDRR